MANRAAFSGSPARGRYIPAMPVILRARRVTALALVVAVSACGAAPSGALVGDGSIQLRERGGDWTNVAPGPVPFGDGDALRAEGGAARAVVACVQPLSGRATLEGKPVAGHAVIELADGARLMRRRNSLFDLLSGSVDVHTGPLRTRLVIFHGDVFAEIHETQDENAGGASFRAAADGDALRIEVTKGRVQLLTPVTKPNDLHQVNLVAGESATARPGESPKKDPSDR